MIRYTKPGNLVRRKSDGKLWMADGPEDLRHMKWGWDFCRVIPLPLGWRVITDYRWHPAREEDFDVLWNVGDGWEDTKEGCEARGVAGWPTE